MIGSHMVDRLIADGHSVIVFDNLSTGSEKNVNTAAEFVLGDIRKIDDLLAAAKGVDGIFHFAAIARTPWCIEDPILCMEVNLMGTLNVLETIRRLGIKRGVLSSSSVVYAAETPYKASKLAGEEIAHAYHEMYGVSVCCLRYSNVYGKRQSEEGPSPNVFAALRKCAREKGHLEITGDGEQTRAYTHVSDIVEGNMLAMQSDFIGPLDLTTNIYTSLNDIAKFFNVPIEYIPERKGDIKHIMQDPEPAQVILNWNAKVKLEDGIKDVLETL